MVKQVEGFMMLDANDSQFATMSANPDEQLNEQIYRQIKALRNACQSESGRLQVDQMLMADSYSTYSYERMPLQIGEREVVEKISSFGYQLRLGPVYRPAPLTIEANRPALRSPRE